MLFVILTYVFIFGTAAVDSLDNSPQISTTTNSNGQCSYTLLLPENQCTNASNQQLSSRLGAIEKEQLVHDSRLDKLLAAVVKQTKKLQNHIKEQNIKIKGLEDTLKEHGLEYKKYKDCAEYRLFGRTISGVYSITPEHALLPLSVWCDMETEEGGWTVFQKRQDGSVYFFRRWDAYKKGFGNINGEYWLGNDNIYHLTNQKKYKLRVDLWDFDGKHFWAEYDDFWIENENAKYKMHVGAYKGTAGNALSYHNGMMFTTRDRDNDRSSANCASKYKGAFWYNSCLYANPNAIYHSLKYTGYDSICWYQLTNAPMALKKFEMKIRPMTFHKK